MYPNAITTGAITTSSTSAMKPRFLRRRSNSAPTICLAIIRFRVMRPPPAVSSFPGTALRGCVGSARAVATTRPAATSRALISPALSRAISPIRSAPCSVRRSRTRGSPASNARARPSVVALDHELTGPVGDELLDRPCASTRPPSMIAATSHVFSISSSRCEEMNTVRSLLLDKRTDHPPHVEHPSRVEAVHRLVEDQQLGIREQASRDAEALAHPERVCPDAILRALVEADPSDRRIDPLVRLRTANRRGDPKVLGAGQIWVERRLLDDRADASERPPALARHGQAEHARAASARASQAQQHPDQRRLAGTVVTEKADTPYHAELRGSPRRPPCARQTASSVPRSASAGP